MSYICSTFGSRRIASFVSCAVAVGALALSSAPAMAGCNSGNEAKSDLLNSSNCQAEATHISSTAIGFGAKAKGGGSTALGTNATALGDVATAIGMLSGARVAGANTAVEGATTIGFLAGSTGAGVFSIAIGAGSGSVPGEQSPSARGDYSIAIGGSNDNNNLGARANGYRSIAIGQKSVTADFGTSVGFNTNTAFASTALGTDAKATADGSTAVVRFANASANSSLALGQGAVANRARAVAIGSGSLANVADTVSVGINTARRRIVNVQHGVANSDAATLGQVKAIATTAAIEALANDTIAKAVGDTVSNDLQRELRQMKSMIERLQQDIAELKKQNTAALN